MAQQPSFELGSAKTIGSKPLETAAAKWLGLKSIEWVDESGTQRSWESSYRKKSDGSLEDKPDAVAIFALVSRPHLPLATIIVLQYRPPVGKVVVELPAGLVDANETVQSTALRELYEETGYGKGPQGGTAVVEEISEMVVNDPGMSSANMVLAKVRVSLHTDAVPEPQPDQGEHIVVQVVALKDLYETLQEYNKKEGHVVDARLMHLAWGIMQSRVLA